MKTQHIVPLFFFLGCFIVSAQTNPATNATVHATRPNIYDESADGSKQIARALETATKEHKHVLLIFGANNCGWCHILHTFLESDTNVADVLKRAYAVAMIDVNDKLSITVVGSSFCLIQWGRNAFSRGTESWERSDQDVVERLKAGSTVRNRAVASVDIWNLPHRQCSHSDRSP